MKFVPYILMGVLMMVIAACGGPPANNPLLEKAESAYREAETDSQVVVKAPVALKEAEEALEKSRSLMKNGEDPLLVEHYAYIAKQKVAIARETAELNAAQDEVEQAESKRQRVLIEARKAEAERAERRAREAIEEARKERMKAEELAGRLKELEARPTERGMVLTLGDVLFDFNKANLKPGGMKVVNRLASFMQEYPNRNVQVEGYTDSIGSSEYNENLSLRRALAVQQALVNRGISANRISVRGFGEQFPVAGNETEAGRQRNRRVEIVISDKEGNITGRNQ